MKIPFIILILSILSINSLKAQSVCDSLLLRKQEFHSEYGVISWEAYSGKDTFIEGIKYLERNFWNSEGERSSSFFTCKDSNVYQWDEIKNKPLKAYPLYLTDTAGFFHLIGDQGKITYKVTSSKGTVKINGIIQNNLIKLSSVNTPYKVEFYVKPGYGIIVVSYDYSFSYWDKSIFTY